MSWKLEFGAVLGKKNRFDKKTTPKRVEWDEGEDMGWGIGRYTRAKTSCVERKRFLISFDPAGFMPPSSLSSSSSSCCTPYPIDRFWIGAGYVWVGFCGDGRRGGNHDAGREGEE